MSGSRLFTAIAAIAFIAAARGAPQEMIEPLVRYKQQCIAMSGSTDGYKQILIAIPEIKNCIFKRVDVLEIRQVKSLPESKVDRKIFFDKYCPRFNESVGCFDGLFEGMAKCTGEDSDKIVPVLQDVAYGIVELMCDNDGQLLIDTQTSEFVACTLKLREGIQDCKLSDLTSFVSPTQYGEEQCRIRVETLRECIKQKLDTCDTSTVYNIFEILYNRVMKWMNCHQYNKVGELYNNNIDGAN